MSRLRWFPIIPLLVSTPLVSAQAQEHAHPAQEKLGRVVFPVSCSPEAQRRFERAMAVLHSFWWEEGGNAFGAVLAADSSCAMAHWGLAMNAWGNPFAGGPSGTTLAAAAQSAERAAAMGGKTPREAGFIAAVAALYRNPSNTSNSSRLRAYADTMARVRRDHPKDDEVALYYALSLVATVAPTDTTFAQQKQAAAILNPLFARHPDHPGLAHYIIHANDSPHLAHLGLDAARRYAAIAPSAPHAQHMPTHIFVRLGMWDETIASNWKSYQASVEHAGANGLAGVEAEGLHALDYAVYSYLQQGKDREARRIVALGDSIGTTAVANSLIGGYNRTASQARIALEQGDWKAAANFRPSIASTAPVAAMLTGFTRGIGSARSGNAAQARQEALALDSLSKALAGTEPDWSRIADIKRRAVEAWAMFAAGDTAGGLALAKEAAEMEAVTAKHPVTPGELLPARELEADMLLAAGRHAEARTAYQASLRREPGRARSVFGAARAAELGKDHAAATAGYREYLKMMANATGDRAEIRIARAFVRS